jgi:hypothetical protein
LCGIVDVIWEKRGGKRQEIPTALQETLTGTLIQCQLALLWFISCRLRGCERERRREKERGRRKGKEKGEGERKRKEKVEGERREKGESERGK